MRVVVAVLASMLLAGDVRAQASAPTGAAVPSNKGYVEAVAQSAFSNVTSQSYGVELGITIVPNLQIFVEAGQTGNAATRELGANAQLIAGGLSQSQSNVAFSVKAPVAFGVAGVKFMIPVTGTKAQPYVLGGGGMAKVKQNVTFTIAGTDVTSTLGQFGGTLGTDTSGDFTKPMVVFGGGVAYPMWRQIVLDFQYRFGRIFAEDTPITVSRAGIGIGVRF